MHTYTKPNNMSSRIHLGNHNRRVFDLQTTVGTGSINTQLKESKININTAQGESIVSVVIELESKNRLQLLEGYER